MAGTGADSLTAVLAGAAVYVQLMPPLADVRRAGADTATSRDVRTGLSMGTAALVGVGAIISVAEGDWRPLWLTSAVALLLGVIYEITLRQRAETAALVIPGTSAGAGRWGA